MPRRFCSGAATTSCATTPGNGKPRIRAALSPIANTAGSRRQSAATISRSDRTRSPRTQSPRDREVRSRARSLPRVTPARRASCVLKTADERSSGRGVGVLGIATASADRRTVVRSLHNGLVAAASTHPPQAWPDAADGTPHAAPVMPFVAVGHDSTHRVQRPAPYLASERRRAQQSPHLGHPAPCRSPRHPAQPAEAVPTRAPSGTSPPSSPSTASPTTVTSAPKVQSPCTSRLTASLSEGTPWGKRGSKSWMSL